MSKDEEKILECLLDWVTVTFKMNNVDEILRDLLGMHDTLQMMDDEVEEGRGILGYEHKMTFFGIQIDYTVTKTEKLNQGSMLTMSGQACRSFASILYAQKRTWFSFFQDCIKIGGNFTRLDLAIDDRNNEPYFYISDIEAKAHQKEHDTPLKQWQTIGTLNTHEDHKEHGKTIVYGGRTSDVRIKFYEKNHEQASHGGKPAHEYGIWNRTEIRLRHEKAKKAVTELIRHQDNTAFTTSLLHYYIRFIDKVEGLYVKDCPTSPFWDAFLGDVGTIDLSTERESESFERKWRWFVNQCAQAFRLIYEIDVEEGRSRLNYILENTELDRKHRKIKRDYLRNTHNDHIANTDRWTGKGVMMDELH